MGNGKPGSCRRWRRVKLLEEARDQWTRQLVPLPLPLPTPGMRILLLILTPSQLLQSRIQDALTHAPLEPRHLVNP